MAKTVVFQVVQAENGIVIQSFINTGYGGLNSSAENTWIADNEQKCIEILSKIFLDKNLREALEKQTLNKEGVASTGPWSIK